MAEMISFLLGLSLDRLRECSIRRTRIDEVFKCGPCLSDLALLIAELLESRLDHCVLRMILPVLDLSPDKILEFIR